MIQIGKKIAAHIQSFTLKHSQIFINGVGIRGNKLHVAEAEKE